MRKLGKKILTAALAASMLLSSISLESFSAKAATSKDYTTELFGPNVYVFDESDSQSEIQSVIDDVYATQETNQFGKERYAVLFKPGEYDNVRMKVGFYTQAAGLGELPTDTVVNEFDCNADWMGANSTCNFWRSASNFTVKQTATWAAAQATSLRRMQFDQWLALDQWGQGWASGGFVADTVVKGSAVAWSQQQYCSRNSEYGAWAGGVWNAVFIGMNKDLKVQDSNAKVENNWSQEPGYQYFTTVDKTPVVRETPYLTIDKNDNYSVFVPSVRENSNGTSWTNGKEAGTSIGIDKFYIAKPNKDTADTINAALQQGKHLILTPGIYSLNKAIQVKNANTVVLGLGYATLTPTGDNACIEIADVDGVSVSGLLFDAGPKYTETLLKVGEDNAAKRHADNPTLLSDLFFRVGGATSEVAQSKTCIIINSKDVIGDNFWVWRADHGDGVAWDKNKSENGIVVNGDCVTMYGLFVEHFHEYQTLWNGDYGRVYFYQSELPYDVPNQASWMSHNGTVNGYASYKVADDVTSHEAYGLGIYSFHRDATIDLANAAEVPDADNVSVHNICSVMLAGNPGISHVINGKGNEVKIAGEREQVVSYGKGKVVIPDVEEEQGELQTATGAYADWKNTGITYPQMGQLIAAGVVTVTWNALDAQVDHYDVYVDDVLVDSVKADGKGAYECEVYTTQVSSHQLKIVAVLKGEGKTVTANIRTFFVSKKGMGIWQDRADIIDETNLSWYYNWSPFELTGVSDAIEFVPMIWGADNGADDYAWNWLKSGECKKYKTLLTFNEPDYPDQSDMSYQKAVELWPTLQNSGLRLSSPATGNPAYFMKGGEGDWFGPFLDKLAETGGSFDFTAVHYYQDYPLVDLFVETLEKTYEMTGKPIWITEWGVAQWTNVQNFSWSGGDDNWQRERVVAFMEEIIPILDKLDFVERYAWFPFDGANTEEYGNGAGGLFFDSGAKAGQLTTVGEAYSVLGNPKGYNPDRIVYDKVVIDEGIVEPVNPIDPVTPVDPVTTNLAVGKTAVASSTLGNNNADMAIDENANTRWESEYSDAQWIYVDLGKAYSVTGVNLVWETAAGKNYKIQVSNNATDWTTVYEKTNGVGGTEEITFAKTSARYVRMYGTERTTGYGYSLWEFEVLGFADNAENPVLPEEPSGNVNVAKDKAVTTSSNEGGFIGNNVTDGNEGTRWASNQSDNEWLCIDLGSAQNISKVILKWEAAYGKSYEIQVSQDGTNFTTVAKNADGKGGVEEISFNKTSARYVRIQGVQRATGYGYSLWEVEVY
ncbi:galactose-binding domain-containing protein [Anaerosporobacter sp.]|uniref:galactose-binding domain-containing protein n=1 Tax=Anaerosporobacter sp. TaxID=1872529 RepID=UPI00286F5353|nr:discoidin domain-containing protein [Anaerosporobacter sp.]